MKRQTEKKFHSSEGFIASRLHRKWCIPRGKYAVLSEVRGQKGPTGGRSTGSERKAAYQSVLQKSNFLKLPVSRDEQVDLTKWLLSADVVWLSEESVLMRGVTSTRTERLITDVRHSTGMYPTNTVS